MCSILIDNELKTAADSKSVGRGAVFMDRPVKQEETRPGFLARITVGLIKPDMSEKDPPKRGSSHLTAFPVAPAGDQPPRVNPARR